MLVLRYLLAFVVITGPILGFLHLILKDSTNHSDSKSDLKSKK